MHDTRDRAATGRTTADALRGVLRGTSFGHLRRDWLF